MRKETLYKPLVGMVVPALLVTVICAAPALAADGGHDAPRWGDFGWRVLNLIIFGAILWHFLGKLTVTFFKGRKQKIQDGIDNLTERKAAAKAQLEEIEARIANLEEERNSILEESKKQAEALKQDIIAKAEAQAKQIVESAKIAAETEGQSLVQQLRATIADELIEATQSKLLKALDASEHEKLITNSLKKVVLQ